MTKKNAFTLIELMIVVAIIGLLAAVGVPSMMNAHKNAQLKAREINVVSVNAAKDQWAIINNKRPGDTVLWTDIMEYTGESSTNITCLNVGTNVMEIDVIGQTAYYPIDQ